MFLEGNKKRLLGEMRECQRQIAARVGNAPDAPGVTHLVLASHADVFNLLGHLSEARPGTDHSDQRHVRVAYVHLVA